MYTRNREHGTSPPFGILSAHNPQPTYLGQLCQLIPILLHLPDSLRLLLPNSDPALYPKGKPSLGVRYSWQSLTALGHC